MSLIFTAKRVVPRYSYPLIFSLSGAPVIKSEYDKPFKPNNIEVSISASPSRPTSVQVSASGPRVLIGNRLGQTTHAFWSYNVPSDVPREVPDWLAPVLTQAHAMYNQSLTTQLPTLA